MSKRIAYPIYIKESGDGWYAVSIPDFGNHTQGKDMGEALFMARDAVGLLGISMQDAGEEVPQPYSTKYTPGDNEREYLVDVDFEEYRSEHNNKSVRKNVTLPYYICMKAEKMGINFSKVLQDALLERINA